MEPIPKLNRVARRRIPPAILIVLLVAPSVGFLYGRLAALYARPAVAPVPGPAGLPDETVTIPAGGGFQTVAPRRGLLLARGPTRLIGQEEVSLCDQRRAASADAPLPPLHVDPLLDGGPGEVDAPAFQLALEPAGAPLRPYADDQPLRLTLHDRRLVLLLADTAQISVHPLPPTPSRVGEGEHLTGRSAKIPSPLAGEGGGGGAERLPAEMDAGPTLSFRRDLWLLWNASAEVAAGRWDHAARVRRLADRECPFGRLRMEVYGPPGPDAAESDAEPRSVLWYSGREPAREFRLAPGRYPPPAAPPRREDAELFERALAAGLLRPGEDGRIAVAPADLPLRRTYARARPELLAPRDGEPDWLAGPWDDGIRETHRALHFSASGRYVRQQVETFNARQPPTTAMPPSASVFPDRRHQGFVHIQREGEKLVWRDPPSDSGADSVRPPPVEVIPRDRAGSRRTDAGAAGGDL